MAADQEDGLQRVASRIEPVFRVVGGCIAHDDEMKADLAKALAEYEAAKR